MRITGTAIKLGALSLVLLLFTALIIVVFGQLRFDRTTGYTAIFKNASGLRAGQFVRASGVEVGKVSEVQLINGGNEVEVHFDVDRSLQLFQGTTASIRYLNLIGDRYLELKRGDEVHMLTTGEFAVLKALVMNARQPLTRDKLMNLARGREWDALERSIDVQISRLRRMIEPDPSKPRYIQTVWGVGYVFVPDGTATK